METSSGKICTFASESRAEVGGGPRGSGDTWGPRGGAAATGPAKPSVGLPAHARPAPGAAVVHARPGRPQSPGPRPPGGARRNVPSARQVTCGVPGARSGGAVGPCRALWAQFEGRGGSLSVPPPSILPSFHAAPRAAAGHGGAAQDAVQSLLGAFGEARKPLSSVGVHARGSVAVPCEGRSCSAGAVGPWAGPCGAMARPDGPSWALSKRGDPPPEVLGGAWGAGPGLQAAPPAVCGPRIQ